MSTIDTHETALKSELTAFKPAVAAIAAPHLNFAMAWPAAREALTLLGGLVPASLRIIISIVTSVGDTISSMTHPTLPTPS